jgi:hypothetical protein
MSQQLKQRQREQARAVTWARGLGHGLHDFIDQLVLGDFDWRLWFEDRPTSAFLNAAFDEAQRIEESDHA